MWRRVFRFLLRRFVPSSRLLQMHSVVLQRFPQTPWVYGGAWSFFAEGMRFYADTIVYPYLPLVLVDRECLDGDQFADLVRRCAEYGVRLVDVRDGEVRLNEVLDLLEGKGVG